MTATLAFALALSLSHESLNSASKDALHIHDCQRHEVRERAELLPTISLYSSSLFNVSPDNLSPCLLNRNPPHQVSLVSFTLVMYGCASSINYRLHFRDMHTYLCHIHVRVLLQKLPGQNVIRFAPSTRKPHRCAFLSLIDIMFV